jgi:hypothetical protein
MKKYFVITLASVAALSLTISCSKEKDVLAPEVTPQPEKITISASFPEEGLTKVGFVEDGYNNKLNLIWQAGDKITITDEADPSNTQTFDIVSGMGTKSATFSGTAPAAAASYKITYNGNPANYAEQTQAADGDTGHLKYVATITGVTDYSSFTFPAAGSSAVLRLRTSIPDSFFGNVKAVAIKAGAASVKVNITNSADAGETHVFTVYASLPGEMAIPAGTKLFVSFQMDDTKEYLKHTAYRELNAMILAAGKVNTINLNCLSIETSAGAADDGTAANPYLIADQYQMKAMHNVMAENATKYFKMVEDVDMTGVAWTVLNNAGSFTKGVDFDGADHVISHFSCSDQTYASFFGVLNGSCHDVSFTDATISSAANSACAIVAGYAGSGAIHAEASRIHVHGTVTFKGNKTGIGGLFGTLGNATIDACSADVTVSSGKNFVGGIYGYAKTGCVVRNCWTAGSITGNQRVGGIGGGTDKTGTNVKTINCYSLASVHGAYAIGGIGGLYNLDNNAEALAASNPNNYFEKCIAWNSEVRSTSFLSGDKTHYSNGMVVGYTSLKNYLTDCVRRPDAVYNTAIFFDYTDVFSLYDQDNSNPTTPLEVVAVTGANYNWPYHGKAAAAGKTVSDVAQALGWDPAIWDFSTDYPTLK